MEFPDVFLEVLLCYLTNIYNEVYCVKSVSQKPEVFLLISLWWRGDILGYNFEKQPVMVYN